MPFDDSGMMPGASPTGGEVASCNARNAPTALTQMCSTSAESSPNASRAGGQTDSPAAVDFLAQRYLAAIAKLADAEAAIERVRGLAAEDLTEPDEDGDRCERLLYPRTVRAALDGAS